MISRRQFLAATASGVVVGLAGMTGNRSDVSLRFIGRRSTIITLLDTGVVRALVLVGDRDDELLGNIAGLKTVGNTRIDLVIGSHRVLASRAAREHLTLDSTPAVTVQAHTSLPPIRGKASIVTQRSELTLGSKTSMVIAPSGAGISESNPDHPPFAVSVNCLGTRVVLASSEAALRLDSVGTADMVVIPGAPGIATMQFKPQLVVCNSSMEDSVASAQLQVYRSDPVVVRIGSGGIHLRDDQLSS